MIGYRWLQHLTPIFHPLIVFLYYMGLYLSRVALYFYELSALGSQISTFIRELTDPYLSTRNVYRLAPLRW